MEDMILLITSSSRIKECAETIKTATGHAVDLAPTLQQAGSRLRALEYVAVIVDQLLIDGDPDESDQMLQHSGAAALICVNFAISGIERVVRETRMVLARRQREEQVARQSAEQAVWSELREDVTAMLLSCDLALAVPGLPTPVEEKIRSVHDLACHIRARLAGTE